ncbi:MAG TPA: alpha/beta hydrolase [Ktedonobacteraceae bacterium]|jgi:acetyl esterase/lipase|nr:alpha/beta hydrolase [Ktedonobacteraceae bacterium]
MADFNELQKKRIVYEIAGMEQSRVAKNRVYKTMEERDLLLDVYYPADMRDGEQRPAVVFVHGLGPAELVKHIKDSGQYVSWAQFIAASGFIAITFNHRSPDEHTSLKDVGGDVDELVAYVREHALELQIDKERLAIWAGSAGVPLGVRSALRGTPSFVKCLVAYYGPLDLEPLKVHWHLTEEEVREFSAPTYLEESAEKLAPMLITRAGLDFPELNATIDHFIKEASAKNVTLDFMTHPGGQHAFDILDDVARSREIIQRTLEFLKTSLISSSSSRV